MNVQGKKVACFVALPHHTRFLFPVLEALEKRGAEALFFTTLSDFPFERDLIKKGRECRLLQSYATPETGYQRKAMLDEFFKTWTPRCFDWDGYRHWPFVLQASLLNCGFEEFLCLDLMIEKEKPDVIMALHERNRWGKLLGFYARKYGIPYVTLQEGDYYEDRLSFSGHTEYTTALLLWGHDTEGRLTRLKSAPEKMINVGNTHLDNVKKTWFGEQQLQQIRTQLNIPPGKPVVLFLVGVQWGMIIDEKAWLDLLWPLNDREDITVVLKWHPKVAQHSFIEVDRKVFKGHLGNCIVVQNFDPYPLLAISDYCVTLGNTTLAVEALSFGKPVFSLPGIDKTPDQYVMRGIAMSVYPPGDWQRLDEVLNHGVPEKVKEKVDKFLNNYFFQRNEIAVESAADVIEYICEIRHQPKPQTHDQPVTVSGRLSIIIPAGDDAEILFATLTTLADKCLHPDWEAIVVVGDQPIREALGGVSGDLHIVDSDETSLGALYNAGSAVAGGDVLAFIRPGIAYLEAEDFTQLARERVVGLPIRDTEGDVYSLGYYYDFNAVPRFRVDDSQPLQAVGGGFIAMSRAHFSRCGGFDPRIASGFVEADFCLTAAAQNIPFALGEGALFLLHDAYLQASSDDWRGNIGFFAKWVGLTPKSEDYIGFAGDLLDF